MKLFKAFGLKKAHDTQDGLWDDPPPEEAGEGVPIKGREETPKQKSERHYQMSERPQSHSSRGQTLADKRQGRLAAAIKMLGF